MTTMSADDPSQIMNYIVRMITPLRREFGRSLDVQQFLHDVAYATEVMEQALRSQDARLREYAAYVQQHYHGPRQGNPATDASEPLAKASDDASKTAKEAPKDDRLSADEAELKARMMKKYTDGLR